MLMKKDTQMMQFRVCHFFLFISLIGMIPGCGPPSAESLSRERLRKLGVQFEKTNVNSPFANIPAAETGRLLVFVPFNMGSGGGWTDADFKSAVDDLRNQVDLDFLMLRLTQITDESMSDVATLTQLRHLNLSYLNVTDDGIAKLGT